LAEIVLKTKREGPLLRRHPWIFSGAVAEVWGEPAPGDTVAVLSAHGEFLAWASYSPASQIRARVWAWELETRIDDIFFQTRLQHAWESRATLFDPSQTNAYRVVHAESDGLPGIILDRYGDLLVLQCLSTGADRWKATLVELLPKITGLNAIYERSDVEVRKLEGLPSITGSLLGEAPLKEIPILENGLNYLVDVKTGQKTGFYLDQRVNRHRARSLAYGRVVLNCFSYTGGFTAACLAGGAAKILSIDTSEAALHLAQRHVSLNQLPADRTEWRQEDVFAALRKLRDENQKYDMVILDPPKFAPTKAQLQRASRGYKDINLLGFKLLNPGGLLMTFSCSGGVDAPLFQKIVADAALDAAVNAQILERLGPGPDHPVGLNFPEGAYLKGLVCRVN
jgi:23S rRNA (cytosine1962-C5)-methyltransferase